MIRAVAAAGALATICERPAVAEDAGAAAEQLIRRGIELRRVRDDEGAQREFQKAYDLAHTPRAAGQLGLAEQALGRWEDAETHVSEAIRASANDAWVAKNRGVLDQALGTIQAHLGRIEVVGTPAGATVWVNGREVGKLPLAQPGRISAGLADVEMRAPGYTSAQRTVTIVGGQYQRLVIHLSKEGSATASEAKVTTPKEAQVTTPTATGSPPEPADAAGTAGGAMPAKESSNVRPILKWTAAGLAGAALITGVVFTIAHSKAVTNFEKSCRTLNDMGVDLMGQMSTSCSDKYQTNKHEQYAFIASYAAAGAFAATWLVLHLTEQADGSSAEHASRGPVCVPSGSALGVSCALRF